MNQKYINVELMKCTLEICELVTFNMIDYCSTILGGTIHVKTKINLIKTSSISPYICCFKQNHLIRQVCPKFFPSVEVAEGVLSPMGKGEVHFQPPSTREKNIRIC